MEIERYIRLHRLESVVVSPCGTWVAMEVARLSEAKGNAKFVSDLWCLPLDGEEREPIQLTRGEWQDKAPGFRRDGSLAFLSDRPLGMDECRSSQKRMQVWLLPKVGGEPFVLTDEPLGVQRFQFATRANRLVVQAPVLLNVDEDEQRSTAEARKKQGPTSLHYRRMPVRFWDHWLPEASPHLVMYDENGDDRLDLTPKYDRELRGMDWTLEEGGRWLVAGVSREANDRVFDVDVQWFDLQKDNDDKRAKLQKMPEGTSCSSFCISPDATKVAFSRTPRRMGEAGKRAVWVLERESDKCIEQAKEWDRWPEPVGWRADGTTLLCSAHDDGTVALVALDTQEQTVTRLTSREMGGSHMSVQIHPTDESLVGLRHTLLHPPEVFRCVWEPEAKPALLTGLSGFTEEEGRKSFVVERMYSGSPEEGGVEVQSFVVQTKERHETEAMGPGLVWIHGGPISHFVDGWQWRWNPLLPASEGYTVLMPNPRGSTGFGQEFVEGIWGNVWGGACYDDIQGAVDEWLLQYAVDSTRVAAMGGSFGGYMTNWIGVNTDRFRCLVSHAGLFALSQFYGTTDLPAWWSLQMGSKPWERSSEDERYSPIQYASQWKSPVLLIHGEKDYRVPVSEALLQFEVLQGLGVPSELLIFPDENHWILRPRNIVTWYQKVFEFLAHHLQHGSHSS